MNPNRLTLKDYILIYFFIFLIAAFLGGFFLGAKVMENQLLNYPNTAEQKIDTATTTNELVNYNDKIYEPTRIWNIEVKRVMSTSESQEEIAKLIASGEQLLANIKNYTFESQYTNEAVKAIEKSIYLTIKALEKQDEHFFEEANYYYLSSQKNYYRSIWVWEQAIQNPDQKQNSESLTNWEEWDKSGLHQKNYITSIILEKEEINTFVRPEDITVHIDAYLKSGSDTSLELNDVIKLLVNSEAIHENAFIKYKDYYPNTNYPTTENSN